MTFWTAVHWIHLMAAILWVGGTLSVSLLVQPAMRKVLSREQRLALLREVGQRFSYLQWSCWAALGVTGALKVWARGPADLWLREEFGLVLALKLIMVAAMVVLSLLHSEIWGPRLAAVRPDEPSFATLAARAGFWGRVNALLMLGIIACAARLHFV